MLKLYFAPNTAGSVVALILYEGGVHWEKRPVDFASAEQTKPDYLAINPKGRVPALVTPGGVLTEVGAVIEYLGATVVPDLVPVDPFHAAKMREIMYYLASTAHVNHAHKMRGPRWADNPDSWADMKAKVPETMSASAAFLEDQIEGPFLFGDTLTLADPYLFVVARWCVDDGVEMSAFPKLATFMEAMEARPAVKQARAEGVLR